MYLIVSILHSDVPGLKKIKGDAKVQEAFSRHMKTPEDSQFGKGHLAFY